MNEKNFEGMMFCDFAGYCKGFSCKNYYNCKGLEKEEEKDKKKKTLINTKIKEEEMEKYINIILKKALKIIACSGSMYAFDLLDGKDWNTLEDLKQEIAIQLLKDNFVITRNAYKVVRKFLYYNYEKTPLEIFTEEAEENGDIIEKAMDKNCYISFLNNNNEQKVKKAKKINTEKLFEKLSEMEKRIYNYYFINNMQQCKIAEMLEKRQGDISNYIKRIKEKALKYTI